MVLHNDIDPLPDKRVEKTKFLTKTYLKIKPSLTIIHSKLATAIFLLGGSSKKTLGGAKFWAIKTKSAALSFFDVIKPYGPHLSIASVAIVVILSNLVVKYAKADYTLSYPEPAVEITFAGTVDQYTPLIKNDGVAADLAYQNSGDAFVALSNTIDTRITQRETPLPDNSQSTVTYEVKSGDTLTLLSWKFDVKTTTLMYYNNLDDANVVKPGQKLKIPPKGYEMSASAIAKIQASKQTKLAAASRTTVTRNSSSSRGSTTVSYLHRAVTDPNNTYPYGYCTWFAKSRRPDLPNNLGNAKNWPSSARSQGYSVTDQPTVGAVGVTSESWWGHVTIVESVSGGMVTVSEMNAIGWGKTDTRTLLLSAFRAFIN